MGFVIIRINITSFILLGYFFTGFSTELYINKYDDGYGVDWIYFPDGDGRPIFVNLSATFNQSNARDHTYIEYKLYTRDNTKKNYIILDDLGLPIDDNTTNIILSNVPLKIVTHGWRSTADKSCVKDIKDAYLQVQDVNVITVDWSYTSYSIFYHWVANETKSVGKQVAEFLNGLNKYYNVTGDQIHLIGHSLGAHVMGIAASQSNLTVDRITGLDPARPLFENPNRDNLERLDSTDAKFVDIIHTCGGLLGIEEAVGTADFFPNSGVPPQPGCDTFHKIIEACSHSRSHDYFIESIRAPKAFPAFHCENWYDYLANSCGHYDFMGESVSRNVSGKFYLKTNPSQPFGRHFETVCLFG